MCMGGGGGSKGPTAEELERQRIQDEQHQQTLDQIALDRQATLSQQQALQEQQASFQQQQNDYQAQLVAWTKKQAQTTTPAAPAASGLVSTGADAAITTDEEAASSGKPTKRGRAALKIDLTNKIAGATGLNIPIG